MYISLYIYSTFILGVQDNDVTGTRISTADGIFDSANTRQWILESIFQVSYHDMLNGLSAEYVDCRVQNMFVRALFRMNLEK